MLDRVVVGGGRTRTLFFFYLCLLYSTLHLLQDWKLEYRRAERQRKKRKGEGVKEGLLLLHSSVVTTIYPTEYSSSVQFIFLVIKRPKPSTHGLFVT